jgi:hypothetical protein
MKDKYTVEKCSLIATLKREGPSSSLAIDENSDEGASQSEEDEND